MSAATTLLAILFVSSVFPAISPAQGGNTPIVVVNGQQAIPWLLANVSSQRIFHLIYDLQNFTTRYVYNTTQIDLVAQYIFNDFALNPGLDVQSHYFYYDGLVLRNIIATIPAFDSRNKTVYIVGGHYDSYAFFDPLHVAPGADDDASGVAAMMEAARVLSSYKFNASIVFSAWSAEEVGVVGSHAYAEQAYRSGMQIGAMIQMDMVGFYTSNMGLEMRYASPDSWLADAANRANSDFGIGLRMDYRPDAGWSSDSMSFADLGYDVLELVEIDGFSPHSEWDTIDKLSIPMITKTAQVVAATVAGMAGILDPGGGLVTLDKDTYKPGDSPSIKLNDADLNVNPTVKDSAFATMFSDTEPIGESVVLTETGPDTDVFTGSMELVQGPPQPGKLSVSHGDRIRVEYVDASPPSVSRAFANVDSMPPDIEDVSAHPDVDFALVKWTTDEPTNATVLYGETPALGQEACVFDFEVNHSVLLNGLRPGTTYYYDVWSSDRAGNEDSTDNGGNHFRFQTLIGSMGRPRYGYVGYVSEMKPDRNFLTSPEVLGTGHVYIGAAQLEMDPIPQDATITNATFEILGDEWVDRFPPSTGANWTLSLLDSSVDAGWTTKNYFEINNASSDAEIPPRLFRRDMDAEKWNAFTFLPSQYGILRNHAGNGRISFRLVGSTRYSDFFAWYSGNQMTTTEMAPTMPRFRVTYSLTGDANGPLVTSLSATPNPTGISAYSTIRVSISDMTTGGSNLSRAEYFWGSDPGTGNATPLISDDGGYDSPTESATMLVDLSSLPPAVYVISFRGRDQSGNWGPAKTLMLHVGVPDVSPPTFDALRFVPPVQESGLPVNVSVRVTDNIAVYGAWAAITDPIGHASDNITMSLDPLQDRYYSVLTYEQPGNYQVRIWANDTSDKWNSTAGFFDIVDKTPPEILLASNTTILADDYNEVNVTVQIQDKWGLKADGLTIEWRDSGGALITNASLIPMGASRFYHTIRLRMEGTNRFRVTAVDSGGNTNVLDGEVLVALGLPPIARAGESQNVTTGATSALDGSASSDDFGIVRFVWHVVGPGIDDTLEGEIVNYTFSSSGTYTIELTVYDSANRSDSDVIFVNVHGGESKPQNQDNTILIIGATTVALAVILLFIKAKKRKRGSANPRNGDEEVGEGRRVAR